MALILIDLKSQSYEKKKKKNRDHSNTTNNLIKKTPIPILILPKRCAVDDIVFLIP